MIEALSVYVYNCKFLLFLTLRRQLIYILTYHMEMERGECGYWLHFLLSTCMQLQSHLHDVNIRRKCLHVCFHLMISNIWKAAPLITERRYVYGHFLCTSALYRWLRVRNYAELEGTILVPTLPFWVVSQYVDRLSAQDFWKAVSICTYVAYGVFFLKKSFGQIKSISERISKTYLLQG